MSKEILQSNIQYLRNRYKGISGSEMSRKLKLSKGMVGHWETGYITPQIKDLISLSKYFGISIDDLVRYDFKLFEN